MVNASANQDQKKAVAQAKNAANAVALVNAPNQNVAIPVHVVPIKCA